MASTFSRISYVTRLFILITLVITVTLLSTTRSAKAAEVCGSYVSIDNLGKYWINNNWWGQDTGTGTQCIWDTSLSGSNLAWGTDWNWTGQSDTVKSYASAVLGWHWGWKNTNTGLPVQLSKNTNISTNWNYNVTLNGNNSMNVTYDLWLHTISDPTWEHNPTDEVMIWLYRTGDAKPVGSLQATVNIAGTTWELWRGSDVWNVYSFVRTSNTNSANLNLQDFLNELISRGWVSSNKYLTSIQAGTEVRLGEGRMDTNNYSVNIGGNNGGNTNPSVNLTSPTNNASYTAPATINLAANASDSDGNIDRVEFYNGNTLLGTDTNTPYSYTWNNVAAGNYTITAKAYDNAGGNTTSNASTVTVNNNNGGGDQSCSVNYSVNQWYGGFTANITITNNGTSAINGWNLAWTWPNNQSITNTWSAIITQSGSQVTAQNMSYNASIPANGNINFGFNGSFSGSNNAPTSFTLNGQTCSIA